MAKKAVPKLQKALEDRDIKMVTKQSTVREKQRTSTTLGKTTFTVLMVAPFTEALSLIAAQRLLF